MTIFGFLMGLAVIYILINGIFHPDSHELNKVGKIIRQIMLVIFLSLTILMSFQMGRIEGHFEAAEYVKNIDNLPDDSPFKAIWHNILEDE